MSSMESMAARYRECMVSFRPNIMKRISIILVTVLHVKRWMLNELPHANSGYSAGFMIRHGMFDSYMMLPIY